MNGSNEQKCSLPFQINDEDFYFCQLNDITSNYECKIDNGENRVCSRSTSAVIINKLTVVLDLHFI